MANPTLLKTPIASGGDKNVIPETTGSTTGLLSQEKGWQQINSLPINAGGIAPSRLDFNGVFNLLSNILFYAQKGWQWEFDETQSYFAGCTVKDTVDGKTYVCIADVNASTTHPSSDTTHWKLSDLATKDDLANYLPLAGGSMTGSTIKRNITTSNLTLQGGTSGSNGAFIELYGSDSSSYTGRFLIQAGGNNNARLTGTPEGNLYWNGHNVLTDANGGYLPLSGGAMTGDTISRSVNNGSLSLYGADNYANGAYIQLRNGTQGTGEFDIIGHTPTSYCALYGIPTGENAGTLTWCGNDLGGASIVAKSFETTGYRKRADGLTIQWGYVTPSGADNYDVFDVSVSFPISFSNACFGVYVQSVGAFSDDGAVMWRQINSVTKSGFKFSRIGTRVETGRYWFAIGN